MDGSVRQRCERSLMNCHHCHHRRPVRSQQASLSLTLTRAHHRCGRHPPSVTQGVERTPGPLGPGARPRPTEALRHPVHRPVSDGRKTARLWQLIVLDGLLLAGLTIFHSPETLGHILGTALSAGAALVGLSFVIPGLRPQRVLLPPAGMAVVLVFFLVLPSSFRPSPQRGAIRATPSSIASPRAVVVPPAETPMPEHEREAADRTDRLLIEDGEQPLPADQERLLRVSGQLEGDPRLDRTLSITITNGSMWKVWEVDVMVGGRLCPLGNLAPGRDITSSFWALEKPRSSPRPVRSLQAHMSIGVW